MHLPRFIVESIDIGSAAATSGFTTGKLPVDITLPPDEAHHLEKVLRLQLGDPVALYEISGKRWFSAAVSSVQPSDVRLRLKEELLPTRKTIQHTLIVGLTSSDTCELIVEKATELGVAAIRFFAAERSQFRIAQSQAKKKLERLDRLVRAALKQSGAAQLPTVEIYRDLQSALPKQASESRAGEASLRLVFLAPELKAETAITSEPQAPEITEVLSPPGSSLENLGAFVDSYILIGPEGGLTPAEVLHARNGGFRAASLGGNTLRTETAAIVALALVQALTRR